MRWSPERYLAFEDERTRPVRDLLAAVPTAPVRRAVDLGCGPGNSTEVLIDRFPGAEVHGVDRSEEMLAAARARLPGVPFALADIETWDDPGGYDVILANAVLQWMDGHERLLPRMAARLAPGGSLAVQMPDNLDEPTHRLMREVAADGPWAERLAGPARARGALATPDAYFAMLREVCDRVDVWRTTYHHPLAGGPAAVVDWFRGSALRPFLAALGPEEGQAYLARYTQAVAAAYPAQPDGTVLLAFPRLFLVATAAR